MSLHGVRAFLFGIRCYICTTMTPMISDNSIAIGITIVTFAVLYIFVFIMQREHKDER